MDPSIGDWSDTQCVKLNGDVLYWSFGILPEEMCPHPWAACWPDTQKVQFLDHKKSAQEDMISELWCIILKKDGV